MNINIMNFNKFIKNGFYLPILSIFIYLLIDDIYLPIFFFLKAFSFNHYYHYNHLYPHPNIYKWKHFFRLTDTGHIAAFMFYFNKKTLPIAHNIHFIIDVGYYFAKIVFNMESMENIKEDNTLYKLPQIIHENTNHNLSYFLIIYFMFNDKQKDYEFNNYSLIYTFIWIYTWLLFLYIPWVLITDDYIYSVLAPSKPIYIRLGMILFMNVLGYVANIVGKFLYSI